MRIPRALTLTATTALAALALTATASAQDLEATNAATTEHCGEVTPVTVEGEVVGATGGCEVDAHSTGGVELSGHQFGIEQHIFDCLWEFTARLDEDAEGYLINQSLTGPDCVREPCEHSTSGQKEAWPVHGRQQTTPYTGYHEALHLQFCIAAISDMSTENTCEFNVPVRQIDGPPNMYRYELLANDLNGTTGGTFTPRCELTGHWTTETDMDDVAITHVP